MTSYGRLLANRDFRRLWVAQIISTTGDWLVVGLVIDIAAKLSGGSSSAVGALMSSKIAPALLFGAIVGVLVDRFDRRSAMIVSDVVRASLVVAFVFARQLWQVYALVFFTELFALLFIPAKNALLPNIVGEEDLPEANTLSYMTDQVTMFLGLNFGAVLLLVFDRLVESLKLAELPLLGPYVPRFLGAQAGLTLDAISFVLSAVIIWRMSAVRSERRFEPISFGLVGRDVREGWRFLTGDAQLRSTMMGVAFAAMGIGTIYTAGYAYTADVLGYGRSGAGFTQLIGVFAFGMLIGALAAAPVGRMLGRRRALVWGLVVFGLGLMGFALTESRALAGAITVFAGAGMAVLSVNGWTWMQESVDDRLRGRMFVTLETLIRVSLLFALTASGAVADGLRSLLGRARLDTVFFNGPRVTLLAGAGVILAASLTMSLATRKLGRPADAWTGAGSAAADEPGTAEEVGMAERVGTAEKAGTAGEAGRAPEAEATKPGGTVEEQA